MINKKVFITVLLLVILTTTLGLVAFSYSWYILEQTRKMDFSLPADGFLIIYFNEDVEYSDTVITPAIAMPYAVRDNLYMDVLREYDEEDEQPSYIEKAATVGVYDAVVNYYNEEENNQINTLSVSVSAHVTLSSGAKVPIDVDRELSIIISIVVEDIAGQTPNYTIAPLQPDQSFTVPPRSMISVTLEAYIKHPDELCAPALNEGPLSFVVTVVSRTYS